MGAGASKNKITSQDKAILDLKVQRDKLKRYQKNINVVIEKEIEAAKIALNQGNKKKALLALKKKKYQVQLLDKTEQQLMNLEELTHSIEYALVEKQVLEGLKKGNEVLNEIHKETSIEAVEKLMDDTADAIAYQNEIDEMLHGLISVEDEEEIMKELDELREQELNLELPDVPNHKLPELIPDDLPNVPTHTPAVKSKKQKQALLAI
ncbi:Snf7 family [Cokeromyces recurvatus]|uniref:Snf7 family n=1 Tax=Cokeromyces recurvatus TaxID=90255 RepID=UPI00221F842B|nr:Snf7 family [Cokeromyces recurvatus]KAI7902053.1 Snf7 family [Cokeromyces recurvatus]